MHAMVVGMDGRFAVLLGKDAAYPAPVAFTLAHELGHVMLNHLAEAPALVDVQDPARFHDSDSQEREADQFALMLLTGSPEPDIQTNLSSFNSPTLAAAVLAASGEYGVEPGTLALCLAYRRNAWAVAMSSLRFIYKERKRASDEVNQIAETELDWSLLNDEGAHFLRNVMFGKDD
ncbi:ImmA/IrrE family metallo-endopeptidase [Consotaella salsifontis]|nr:ImmA/IrrE family metallo-endopeptidase [Consotaella salsifontis]